MISPPNRKYYLEMHKLLVNRYMFINEIYLEGSFYYTNSILNLSGASKVFVINQKWTSNSLHLKISLPTGDYNNLGNLLHFKHFILKIIMNWIPFKILNIFSIKKLARQDAKISYICYNNFWKSKYEIREYLYRDTYRKPIAVSKILDYCTRVT